MKKIKTKQRSSLYKWGRWEYFYIAMFFVFGYFFVNSVVADKPWAAIFALICAASMVAFLDRHQLEEQGKW